MSRVALGHTGRALRVGPAMTWAFALVNLAGLTRVFMPIIIPANYREWVIVSGILWTAAFALFLISYARLLIQPRVDGRPV